jgi:hypothetical protein
MDQEEIKLRLELLKPILMVRKQYSPAEQVEMYAVYNAITSEQRRPNGCSACLNTVITRLKKELRRFGGI